MILVYTRVLSPRLDYILNLLLTDILGSSCSITTSIDEWESDDGTKINYSDNTVAGGLNIIPHSLLFEDTVEQQQIDIFSWNDNPAFFKCDAGFPFDIFAAAFYLVSRYEEYLPHEKDMYGRFAHTESIAFKNNFLHLPLVNIWVQMLAKELTVLFPKLIFRNKTFSFIPTYDIDIAYAFMHKGAARTIGGFIKKPGAERMKVLLKLAPDPYDAYGFLHSLHEKINVEPLYFFLLSERMSRYDKNISPYSNAMKRLIKDHATKYSVGLHPSWRSYTEPSLISIEKEILENLSGQVVHRSRQHYIKMDLPATYLFLTDAGILDDYSMGYGSINGFRASVATSFNWYDLSDDSVTSLRIHPFCFMDANSYYEQKQDAAVSFDELTGYYNICRQINGQLITIFHNNLLGTDPMFKGWREMYSKFTSHFLQ